MLLDEEENKILCYIRSLAGDVSIHQIVQSFETLNPTFQGDIRPPVYRVVAYMMWEGSLQRRRPDIHMYSIEPVEFPKVDPEEIIKIFQVQDTLKNDLQGEAWLDDWYVTIEHARLYWYHCRQCSKSQFLAHHHEFQPNEQIVMNLKRNHWMKEHSF